MSFSAEIKDFVNGFQAGARVGGDIQDRKLSREKFEFDKAFDQQKFDFEKQKYGAANARADKALSLRERDMTDRKSEREAARKERAAMQAQKDEARRANEALPDEPKASRARSAKPDYSDEWYDGDDADAGDSYEDSAIPVPEVTDEEVAYRRGGMVLHAAGGALVPPATEEEEEPRPEQEGKGDLLLEDVKQPIREVMGQWTQESKEKPAAIDTKGKDQSRIADVKPASPEEIKAIDSTIDPGGEMQNWQKGAARLVKAYNFFVEKGDPDKARKIAAQIIKYDQMASMTLGQLAKTAVEQGDLQSASKLLTDAYNENVPDGASMTTQPTPKGTVLFKIDKGGQTVQQGEADAKQIWQMAAKVADGSEYIKRMARIAAEAGGTSESNPAPGTNTGKGKKRSYSADVRAAAAAKAELDDLQGQIENAEDEDSRAELVKQFNAKQKAAAEAMAIAERARVKTGRSMDAFQKDFNAAFKTTVPSAIPDGSEGGDGEAGAGGGWWGEGLGSALMTPWKDQGYGPQKDAPAQEAVPTAPASQPASQPAQTTPAQQPAIEGRKELNGKTYVKINGKWFEQR